MRFLTVLYVLCVTVLSYGSYDDRDEFYDPQFWLAWLIMTAFFVVPLFLIWLSQILREMLCVSLAIMEFVAEKRSGEWMWSPSKAAKDGYCCSRTYVDNVHGDIVPLWIDAFASRGQDHKTLVLSVS